MTPLRRLSAAGALAALLAASACGTGQKAAAEAWLATRAQVERSQVTRVAPTGFGESESWAAEAWVKEGTPLDDVGRLALGWRSVARDGRSTLTVHARGLDFTAQGGDDDEPRWRAAETLLRTVPHATHVTLPQGGGATATAADCDPWQVLRDIDPVPLVRTRGLGRLSVECTSPHPEAVMVAAGSIATASDVDALRTRARRVQQEVPQATRWHTAAERPDLNLRLTGDVPEITDRPTLATLNTQRVDLTVRRGEVVAEAHDAVDLRPAAREAAALGIAQVDARNPQLVVVHLPEARLEELVPVAAHHPSVHWSIQDERLLLRAKGSDLGERVRQFRALTAQPVELARVTMIGNPVDDRPGIDVECAGQDLTAVARAIRAASWRGEMDVTIDPGVPGTHGVTFRSTTTGRAQDPALANSGRAAPTGYPRLMDAVRAWDETAG